MHELMKLAHEFLQCLCLGNKTNQSLLHKQLDLFLTPSVSLPSLPPITFMVFSGALSIRAVHYSAPAVCDWIIQRMNLVIINYTWNSVKYNRSCIV